MREGRRTNDASVTSCLLMATLHVQLRRGLIRVALHLTGKSAQRASAVFTRSCCWGDFAPATGETRLSYCVKLCHRSIELLRTATGV